MIHFDEWLVTLRRNFCLCGNCRVRVDHRIQDLQELSSRLGCASFRAQEHGDLRRARAYASQARAAREEAASCAALVSLSKNNIPYSLLQSVTTAIAAVVSLVYHVDCSRLPQKWPKQFTRMTGGPSSSSPHHNWGNRPRRARGGGGGDWNNNFRGRGSFRGGYRGNRSRGGSGAYHHNHNRNYGAGGGWQGRSPARDNRDWNNSGVNPHNHHNNHNNNNHNRFHGPLDDQRRGPPPLPHHPDDQRRGPPPFGDADAVTRRVLGPDVNRPFLLSPSPSSSRHDQNPPFRNNINRSPLPRWNMDRRHGGGGPYYTNPPQLTSNITHHSRHNVHAPVPQRNMPPPFYSNDYDGRGGSEYDYKDEFSEGNSNTKLSQQPPATRNGNNNSNSPDNAGNGTRRHHPGLSMPLTAGSASSSARNAKSTTPRFTSVDEPPRKNTQSEEPNISMGGAGASSFSDAKPPDSPPTSHPRDLRNTLTRGSAEKRRDDMRAAAASRIRRSSHSNDNSPVRQANTSTSHTSPKPTTTTTRRSSSSPRFTNIVPDEPASTPAPPPKSTTPRTQSRWSRNTDAFTGTGTGRRRSFSPLAFNQMPARSGSMGNINMGIGIGSMGAARETRKIERRPASPPPVPTQPRTETFRSRGTVSEGGKRSRFHDSKPIRNRNGNSNRNGNKKTAGERKNQDESKRWGDVTKKDVEKEKAEKMAKSNYAEKMAHSAEIHAKKTVPRKNDADTARVTAQKDDAAVVAMEIDDETGSDIRAGETAAPKNEAATPEKNNTEIEAVRRSPPEVSAEVEKEDITATPKVGAHVEKKAEEAKETSGDGDLSKMGLGAMKVGNDVQERIDAAKEAKEKEENVEPRHDPVTDDKKDAMETDDVKSSAAEKETSTEPRAPRSSASFKSISKEPAKAPAKAPFQGPSREIVKEPVKESVKPSSVPVVAIQVPLPASTPARSSPLKKKEELKSERKLRSRSHSPKKRRRTRSEPHRFEDIAPSDLKQEATAEDRKKTQVAVDGNENRATISKDKKKREAIDDEKEEKVNVPKVGKAEDGEKVGDKANEENQPEKMDLGGDEQKTEVKKVPNPPSAPTSTAIEAKSPTVSTVPVFTPNPKLPLPQISGLLPSFKLRSKPNTPNSAPSNKSKPLFDSSDALKVPRFGVPKELDGDDGANTEGIQTAPKLLEEISAVDLEMKSLRKEIRGLKASLDGSLPPLHPVQGEEDSETENRKLAREFCSRLIIDIDKRQREKGAMFILEPPLRTLTVPNDKLLKILDSNRAKARAAAAEFKYLHHQPEETHKILVEQQRSSRNGYVDEVLVEKVRNTIRRRQKEERDKVRNQIRQYRTLKQIWTEDLTAKKDRTSKEKRDIAKERDRYLLVNTRGASALLTCKTSSGRTSTKVLPGLSGGNIINVAEVDSMLADIEKFGGTPGMAQIVQRTLAEIPNQNSSYVPFDSNNLLIDDPIAELHASRARNFWTQEERLVFLNKFLVHQKNFKKVATFIPNKNTNDCVRFYFDNKLAYGLKALVREAASMKRNGTREMTLLKMVGLQPTEYNLTLCGVSQDISATTAKQIAALMGSPSLGIRNGYGREDMDVEEVDEKIFSEMEFVQKTIERSASPGLGKPEKMKERAPTRKADRIDTAEDAASLRLSKAERIERSASPRFGKPGKAETAASPRFGKGDKSSSPRMGMERGSPKLGKADKLRVGIDRAASPRLGRPSKSERGEKAASPRIGKRSKSDRGERSDKAHRTDRGHRATEGSQNANTASGVANMKPKASWTPDERAKVEELFKEHGREFKTVSQIMGTKTAAQVKGYWKKFIKEKEKEGMGSAKKNKKKRDAHEAQLETERNERGAGKREKTDERAERGRRSGKKGTARKIVDDDEDGDNDNAS